MTGRGLRYEYEISELVLCFEPDCTKARVLYDAKVVEKRAAKDESGKRRPTYVVHFQGWNSSWDREVGEHYLLRNTNENRELMQRLADAAKKFSRKNTQRRQKINAILHQAFGGAPPQFDDTDSDLDTDQDSDPVSKKGGKGKLSQDKRAKKPSLIEFELPESLKEHLEHDCFLINKRNKLTCIPAKPCVVDILESFMKTFCVNYLCDPSGGREKTRTSSSKHTLKCPPQKCISLCKEFVDSLRVIFDFTLPIILLYAAEQEQYEMTASKLKTSDLNEQAGPAPPQSKVTTAQSASTKGKQLDRGKRSRARTPSPHRRLTRQTIHSNYKAEVSEEELPPKISRLDSDGEDSLPIIPIASRTRRRSHFEVVEVSESWSVKQEPRSDTEGEGFEPCLPGPSQNATGGACSGAGTESLTLGSSHGREDAMDRILGWQLLPPGTETSSAPSLVYGVVHLLRMFVVLPDLLKKMQLKEVHLQIIIKFIHHCLQYLVDHQSNLITDQIYTQA